MGNCFGSSSKPLKKQNNRKEQQQQQISSNKQLNLNQIENDAKKIPKNNKGNYI